MNETLQPHEAVPYLLQHIGDILDRQLDQVLHEQLGIGMSQYKVLALLEGGEEQGQRMLADNLGQTEASVSRQIGLLGKKGFIQGRINEKNRRQHLVAITPKGTKILRAARQATERYNTPLYDDVHGKQQKQLVELLTSIHGQLCQKNRSVACSHPFHL